GNKTIDVVRQHPDRFVINGLSVGLNIPFLITYLENHPELKFVCTTTRQEQLEEKYPNIVFFWGDEGLDKITALPEFDLMVNALQGFVGTRPTLTAIEHKLNIALANKETMVAAGDLVVKKAKEAGVMIYPVDSEHSAIFQCLQGNRHGDIRRIIITASGGSFRKLTREQLEDVSLDDALHHPNWSMGQKITIDSATMMNKGFEVIEAKWLFDLNYDQIETILHKESVVHSFVEFNDHSLMAQMGVSDMRLPIQYALNYPDRIDNESESLDLEKLAALHFEKLDGKRFPLLPLSYEVGRKGGNMPAIMNAANEAAVDLFLEGKTRFVDIERDIFNCIEKADFISDPTFDQIVESDRWADRFVRESHGVKL
ncbi:MAG: 1-deoxy-D-xylulose-5-phosphate reductoisomerase, partial [Erysipelotrichaceae bacterium]|nr:1-deoxy-D-xylulose-5-phosphate reductoisomerase [Erysipelotrichaceae bacterium]